MRSREATLKDTLSSTSIADCGGGAFLDAYEIANIAEMQWDVAMYTLEPLAGIEPRHQDRGGIVDAMWELKRQHGARCRGWGFIGDIDERTVIVPAQWDLPSGVTASGYTITRDRKLTARAGVGGHDSIVLTILKGAIKKHFKDNGYEKFGPLWRDYGDFCEMPSRSAADEACFCRKFSIMPVSLNGFMVLHFVVSTVTLDGRTLYWYYAHGKVAQLAEMINEKREHRTTRQGKEVAIRVWRDAMSSSGEGATVLELADPDQVIRHASLDLKEQMTLAVQPINCTAFHEPAGGVSPDQLRLVLDTQITGEQHSETIVEPAERFHYVSRLRDFFDGMDVYGSRLRLATTPLSCRRFTVQHVLPPPIRVKGSDGRETTIGAPNALEPEALRRRARTRAASVRRNGFLLDRPIDPALAWPETGRQTRLNRMVRDLNKILEQRRVEYRFKGIVYRDVEDLKHKVERGRHDTLLAVLPRTLPGKGADYDVHEEIKRRIEVPSQCIQIENTLPQRWAELPHRLLVEQDPKLARRIREKYEICIDNLFVKHGWVPFVPAAPFSYNVHIGLDVGGRTDNCVVACMGYGLSRPGGDLFFRLQEIPVETGKAEPIPTRSLLGGLRQLFDCLKTELEDMNQQADFNRVLFIRDGAMLGCGDEWNERDAIELLYQEFAAARLVSPESTWSVVEVLKRAERWRVFSNDREPDNPLVGTCLLGFGSPNEALICTTGRPYLTQGTANPIRVRVSAIRGQTNMRDVIRDLVWEADMGFTKPDIGHGLPWVLHVADTGALQLSRSYRVSGITA